MKYLLFILYALIFCSCDNIEGSGHIQTEKRDTGHFDGVQASGSVDIDIKNGDNFSVNIEADDNVLPFIVAEVNNNLLDIYFKPNTTMNNVHAKVYITAPDFNKIFVKGSGNITSKNTLKSQSIDTKISGSGNIDLTIDAPDVKAGISGSGNLSLEGRCKNFEASISGSGDLKCKKLLSENAEISIFGSGNAHIYSSVSLKAKTIGSGDIYYSGNPSSPEISKTGSGSVEPER